jgi:hypothetical protein
MVHQCILHRIDLNFVSCDTQRLHVQGCFEPELHQLFASHLPNGVTDQLTSLPHAIDE